MLKDKGIVYELYVVVLARVNKISNSHYQLSAIEDRLGYITVNGDFVDRETGETIYSMTSMLNNGYSIRNKYFIYPITVSDLKNRYPDCKDIGLLGITYLFEHRDTNYVLTVDEKMKIYNIETEDEVKARLEALHNPSSLEDIPTPEFKTEILPKFNTNKVSSVDKLKSIKRKDLSEYLKDIIIGNDSIIDDIATTIISNFRTDDPSLIKNILALGATGTGKTLTFKSIEKYSGVPVTIIDCNNLTAEGYVGKGVEYIYQSILATCNNDKELAERSILFLDEVDKIASHGEPVKDIDVQRSLLKVVEGHRYSFSPGKNMGQITMDTSMMTKVASGAFMELTDDKETKHIGFNKSDSVEKTIITEQDIIKYGLLPEFVGRFPLLIEYQKLDRDALRKILLESKISPLLLMKDRFKKEFDTDIVWDDEFIDKIIDKALSMRSGGRSLSKIVDSSFIKLEGNMFDLQDEYGFTPKKLVLSKKMIDDPNKYNI